MLDEATKKLMISKVLSNCWTTAVYLFHDEQINTNDVSVKTIQRMLQKEGLNAYRP